MEIRLYKYISVRREFTSFVPEIAYSFKSPAIKQLKIHLICI